MRSRRRVLELLSGGMATAVAGCSALDDDGRDVVTYSPTRTSRRTTATEATRTTTEAETEACKPPLEGTLDLVPKNEDAPDADANIYDRFDGKHRSRSTFARPGNKPSSENSNTTTESLEPQRQTLLSTA